MSALTYPESMERLNVEDVETSLHVIENYIGYICERTDFAMRNMTKNVTAAGVSSVELYILLQAQAQTLASLQSTMNQIAGQLTSLAGQVSTLRAEVGGAQDDIADLNRRVTDLENNKENTTT